VTLGNMGNIARLHLSDTGQALSYYQEALQISQRLEDSTSVATILDNLGEMYRSQKKFTLALEVIKNSIALNTKLNDLRGISYSYASLTDLFIDLGQLDSALFYAYKQKEVAEKLRLSTRKEYTYKSLAQIFELKGEYRKALQYQKEYQSLKDTIYTIDTREKMAEIEANYKNELQAQEVAILRNKDEINQEKLKNQFKERVIWILVIIILLGGVRLLWLQSTRRKIYAEDVSNQRDEVLKKSEEIARVNEIIRSRNEELNETLNKLQKTQKKLLESEKIASISVLTAGLAHELNNPLNYVNGVIKPIQMDLQELTSYIDSSESKEVSFIISEMNELLDSLSVGVEKVSLIIKNLVEISPKVFSDQQRSIKLNKIIEASIHSIQVNETKIPIECIATEELYVYADYAELNQVFINFLRNSVEALVSSENPKIRIEVIRTEANALVKIIDNGYGMDENTIEKVFQPFFTTKEPGRGTGLGLYISYGIIKKYEGDIFVDSEIGKGTEFVIQLPLSSESKSMV
ncbi:MAG: tetratricopeptide repeat-containing sensor histidine kinase, partial [Bacteroidota bacterium]